MYLDESEDLELFAMTWNLTDKRPPFISLFPLPLQNLADENVPTDNTYQVLRYVNVEPNLEGIINGTILLDAMNVVPPDLLADRWIAYLADFNEIPKHQPLMIERGESNQTGDLRRDLEPLENAFSNLKCLTDSENIAPQVVSMGLIWNGNNYTMVDPESDIIQRTTPDSIMIWSHQVHANAPREYWMMDLPREPYLTSEYFLDTTAAMEILRKRCFDTIEELREEVCKRARRNPIKLGLLGHLARKRSLEHI